MAEHWRVGRHVPHHVYRSDGNTVADEVAVTHNPEDAAQIVADHNDVERLRAVLAEITRIDIGPCDPRGAPCANCAACLACQALAAPRS